MPNQGLGTGGRLGGTLAAEREPLPAPRREPAFTLPPLDPSERKRLVADRFRRIWQIVEFIAREPGHGRRELAQRFALSERQVQADLNIIRTEMRLPLVRRQGYRFIADETRGEECFDLAEAQLLVMVLRRALRDRALPAERLQALLLKLPILFPPHLRPLVQKTLEAVTDARSGRQQDIFSGLADALLQRSAVKLHYPPGEPAVPVQEPIVHPELLVPYEDSWYLIGTIKPRGRVVMLPLDSVLAVSPATGF
jgi:predicted DNA-binding transcriptional regulator YafY